MLKKRVLIITPKFPYPSTGACEMDRASGIEWFVQQGYSVRVITKVYTHEAARVAVAKGAELGIVVIPVVYFSGKKLSVIKRLFRLLSRVAQPWYWDGAAFEYTDPELKAILVQELAEFRPELVWCEYTYLWPLYSVIQSKNVPIVTRSHNFEPQHLIEEDGRSIRTFILYWAKLFSEWQSSRRSRVLATITPREAERYQRLAGPKTEVIVLSLRGLLKCERIKTEFSSADSIRVFFMGSTYNVAHNYEAARFIILELLPLVRQRIPGVFTFYILGGKVPAEFLTVAANDLVFPGYIAAADFPNFLEKMDICLAPSLAGAGMQQKVFEPLLRGLPTITSPRALAGYPFVPNEEVAVATSAIDFVDQLQRLRDQGVREKQAHAGFLKAQDLFSESNITATLKKIISCTETI